MRRGLVYGLLGVVAWGARQHRHRHRSPLQQARSMTKVRRQYDLQAAGYAPPAGVYAYKIDRCQAGSSAHRRLIQQWQRLRVEDPQLRQLWQAMDAGFPACRQLPARDPRRGAGAARLRELGLPEAEVRALLRLPTPERLPRP